MEDKLKFRALIFSGFITLAIATLLPQPNGEANFIFLVTVPFFGALGIVFAFIYKFISKKIDDSDIKGIVFGIMLFFMIALNLMAYPM